MTDMVIENLTTHHKYKFLIVDTKGFDKQWALTQIPDVGGDAEDTKIIGLMGATEIDGVEFAVIPRDDDWTDGTGTHTDWDVDKEVDWIKFDIFAGSGNMYEVTNYLNSRSITGTVESLSLKKSAADPYIWIGSFNFRIGGSFDD